MTPEEKLERRREIGRESYYRQQEKKGKTPVKGKYGLLTKLSPEEYRAYRNLQVKESRAKKKKVLSPEQVEKRKAYQRELYRKRKEEGYIKPSKYTPEELKAIKHEYYMRAKHKEHHPRGVEAMPIEQVLEKKQELLKSAKRRKARRLNPMKTVSEPKPRKPKTILTREEKLAKYREANARRKAKKAPKPIPMPKVKPLRKPKPPREPKTKPEVLPTLVRDESDYVSVRIDAKTVIRVPPGKDIEQVKQRFIAKMLQNSRI